MSETINVTYQYIDGAHFFVTADKKAAGLCVACGDLFTAYSEVSHQLNALFKFNYGENANFKPGVPFDAFKLTVEGSQALAKGADQSGMIHTLTMQPWMILEHDGV